MKHGIVTKVIGRTLDCTFEGVHWAAPHAIKASKVITHNVIIPAGLGMLVGATAVAAKVIAPKRKDG